MGENNKFDLTGTTFGYLTVIAQAKSRGKNSAWLCLCSCGAEKIIDRPSLRRNGSCGCRRAAWLKSGSVNRKHGHSRTATHRTWLAMRSRCKNQNDTSYKYYGAMGIKVCASWMHDFESFYRDMGPRPFPSATIERINTNGNYEPGNCKWATQKDQQNNRSNNRIIEFKGKRLTISQWADAIGIPSYTIYNRLRLGWTDCDALLKPVRRITKAKARLYEKKNK